MSYPNYDLSMDAYQSRAMDTAIFPKENATSYLALKLCGESGEVAEHIGKSIRDDAGEITPARRDALKKELGDVLWYVANLAHELGFSLENVANANLHKLSDRKDRGVLGGSGDER